MFRMWYGLNLTRKIVYKSGLVGVGIPAEVSYVMMLCHKYRRREKPEGSGWWMLLYCPQPEIVHLNFMLTRKFTNSSQDKLIQVYVPFFFYKIVKSQDFYLQKFMVYVHVIFYVNSILNCYSKYFFLFWLQKTGWQIYLTIAWKLHRRFSWHA